MKLFVPASILTFVLAFVILTPLKSHAWGKRGHSIVCQTAAYLASSDEKGEFLKSHSFDLGYYCNVPDITWKKPETYDLESFNHFMDMEIFEREFKDSGVAKPFEMDRLAFNAAFPKIEDKAGRAFWRVRELMDGLTKLRDDLGKPDLTREVKHGLQADWLVHAGAIGHYVGDLAQPLHVTENYDGQLTGQKGLHAFYEDDVVDELFQGMGTSLESDVMKAAQKKWKHTATTLEKKSTLQLLEDLANDSNRDLANVLKLDKKVGRKDIKKAALTYRAGIVDRMATGAVALGVLWKRGLGWAYDGKRFYTFRGEPAFIAPPQAPKTSPTPAKQ